VWRRRTVGDLTLVLAIAFSLILVGFGSALAGKTAPVEIGFLGVPPNDAQYQNVLLNVQAIRINPKVNAAPNDSKWQKIGVPAGIGSGGSGAPELQIDLNNSQNIPQLFNTAKVKPGTYKIAQLILNPNNPGTIVPVCPSAGTPEGCISYPIQLTDAGAPINLIPDTQPLLSANNGNLTQLVIQLTMKVNTRPIQPGAPFLVTISMLPVTSPALGTVTGHLPTGSGSTAKHLQKLAVTAETIGTNTAIASAPIAKDGTYTFLLPAANDFGTLYDLAVAGGAVSYAATRLPPLFPNTPITQNFTLKTNQTLGSITGTITDACSGGGKKPIAGATIQILKAPLSNTALTDLDCIKPELAPQCVSVATANTNNAGLFPLPGTLTIPSAFESVPILTGTDPTTNRYSMMITAPGYDPTFTIANASSGKNGGNCNPDATSKTVVACDFALSRGTISGMLGTLGGTFPITPPIPGETILVQVFAEDTGTNNIVGALANPITVRSTTSSPINFTLNVPTQPIPPATSGGRTFDLFATTIDSFQGISDPFQGHTIAVIPGVAGPAPPSGTGCNDVPAPTSPDIIDCVGHGSVTGSVANPNLGTSVVLSKRNVQITNTPVQNQLPNTPATSSFSFCAPGDEYTVQKLQLPTPVASVVPSAAPTPALDPTQVAVIIPVAPHVGGPTPTPTPALKCPTNCSTSVGTCPGICNNNGLGTVL